MLTFETERALVARAAPADRATPGGGRGRGPDRGRLVTDALETPIHLTPLTDAHRDLGARLIEFGGWLMPVQYGSIIEEHRTVRERVGLFDLSHMGELYVDGPEAGLALAVGARLGPAEPGHRARPVLDDLRRRTAGSSTTSSSTGSARSSFLVVANAGNAAIVSDALAERLDGLQGGPRRPVARDRTAGGPGSAGAPRSSAPLTDVDLGGAALLRRGRGDGRRHPGAGRPDRLHRRGRLRGLRRDGRRRCGCGTRCSRRSAAAGGGAGRARRPRHAPARGRDAALRQRARPRDEPVRGRARPRRQARPSRATSSAARRSRRSPRDGPAAAPGRARSSRAAGSPATATRSGPASGGPGS